MAVHTPKLNNIKQLFILGDSYSDVGWRLPGCPLPTDVSPMGINHPCDWVTWCPRSRWQDNWVQHLSRDRQAAGHELRIYDFAEGGSDLDDVQKQAGEMASLVTDRVVDLDVDKAVLVVWVGINDVCKMDDHGVPRAMNALADILARCYDAGFRHLILFDVPPRAKTKPNSGVSIIRNILIKNIDSWNEALGQQLVAWREKAGASANLFPVGQVFDDIMDQPEKYGFIQADTYTRGGGIWADHVHATEAVHKIVFEAFRAQME